MSSQNLPSMQDSARELRTSGMDANQMYEEVRAIAGGSDATPLVRGSHRSSHDAGEAISNPRLPMPFRRALRSALCTLPPHHATTQHHYRASLRTRGVPAPQGELSPLPSHLLPGMGGIQRRDSDGAGMQAPYVSSQAHLLQPSDYNPMPTAVRPSPLNPRPQAASPCATQPDPAPFSLPSNEHELTPSTQPSLPSRGHRTSSRTLCLPTRTLTLRVRRQRVPPP